MTTAAPWRVFCAFDLPAQVRELMGEHIQRLRKDFPDAAVSWGRVENFHLTVKFLGGIEIDRVELISTAAAQAIRDIRPFEIFVGKTGVFPRPSRPQVLWIGVTDPQTKLAVLHERLENACAAEGFEKEDRAYHPHLTVARIRKSQGARQLADAHLQMKFESVPVELNELIVFRSELSSKGPRYTTISRHQFSS